ncbi:MAG: hypothetical protein MJZ30_14145 [Paludibacteraceae bacterium]|nr:hypothetical protein [Paludibacteraceae bacterium]
MNQTLKISLSGVVMLLMSLGCIIIGSGIEAKIAGWLGLVFFGACTISLIIHKVKHGASSLEITKEGVVIGKTLVRWDIIEAISKTEFEGTEIWLFHTANIEEDIQNTEGFVERWSKKFSYKTLGAIYSVSAFLWNKDFFDFARECLKWKSDIEIIG